MKQLHITKLAIHRHLFCLVLFCLSMSSIVGQTGITVDNGALSHSLGGISSVINGPEAILNNFANIVNHEGFSGIVSSSNRFGLSELTSVSLGVQQKLGSAGHLGLSLSRYGFDAYSEQTIRLRYARRLATNLSISGNFGLYSLNLDEFGSKNKVSFGLGLAGSLGSQLEYGLRISNPERISVERFTKLISEIVAGFKYKVSEKVSAYGELGQEISQPLTARFGLLYHIHTKFSLSAGFNTLSSQTAIGFGLKFMDKLRLNGTVSYHPVLGISPGISFSYGQSQTKV